MPFFDHDGLNFHYHDQGEGLSFIFLHGLGGSLQQPVGIFSPPIGIRLISMDFRGHGSTALGKPENIRFNVFGDDIVALMDHLKIDKAVIGGISMGSAVALNVARRFPERLKGLVISRPAWLGGAMPAENRRLFRNIEMLLQEYGAKRGREVFEQSRAYSLLADESPSVAKSFLIYFDYNLAKETAIKYLFLPADMPNPSPADWKSQTCVPTLILANRLDPVHAYEYGEFYAEHLPHSEFRELTPKNVNEEDHKRDTQKYIEQFLKGII